MVFFFFFFKANRSYHIGTQIVWWCENNPIRCISLDICSPVVRTVWEGVRGEVLMEDVCHWCQALRLQEPMISTVNFPCLMMMSQDVSLCYCTSTMPAAYPLRVVHGLQCSETINPK